MRMKYAVRRVARGLPAAAALLALTSIVPAHGAAAGAAHGAPGAAAPVPVTIAALTPNAASADALRLGMPYVVPPHKPGAKVRTPEGLAPLLVERLEKELALEPVAIGPQPAQLDASRSTSVDALLVPVDSGASKVSGAKVIPTGYRAGIMAIMRTDTDIHRWEDLRDRTVCLTEGSGLVGQMHAQYGAIEKVFRAPADALLDLRIGGCDAAVHDSTMLKAILQFPEWKKFSAQLPIQQERDLAFVLTKQDPALAATLQSQVGQWQASDLLQKLTRQSARDIAFEVYMDQEVPDCH